MTFACVSDIHGAFYRFRSETLPNADAVLVAGDLTNWGRDPRGGYDSVDCVVSARRWLNSLGGLETRYLPRDVFAVAGNHDIGLSSVDLGEPFVSSRHGKIVRAAGLPGKPPEATILHASLCTAFDVPELAISWAHTTASPIEDADYWASQPPADIVLSHCPPLGVCDEAGRSWEGTGRIRHIGSYGLLAYMRRYKPALVVCGHCHEARGFRRVRYAGDMPESLDADAAAAYDTLVVNCAQAVALVDYDAGERKARMLSWEVRLR